MLLSARMLGSVGSVNDFEHLERVDFTESDATRIYIQLIDLNKDKATAGFSPAGRRYMPAASSTLQITLVNLDEDKKLVRSATQAYPTLDPSIWYIDVLATDTIVGTCTMKLALTQSGAVTRGAVKNAVGIARKG